MFARHVGPARAVRRSIKTKGYMKRKKKQPYNHPARDNKGFSPTSEDLKDAIREYIARGGKIKKLPSQSQKYQSNPACLNAVPGLSMASDMAFMDR